MSTVTPPHESAFAPRLCLLVLALGPRCRDDPDDLAEGVPRGCGQPLCPLGHNSGRAGRPALLFGTPRLSTPRWPAVSSAAHDGVKAFEPAPAPTFQGPRWTSPGPLSADARPSHPAVPPSPGPAVQPSPRAAVPLPVPPSSPPAVPPAAPPRSLVPRTPRGRPGRLDPTRRLCDDKRWLGR